MSALPTDLLGLHHSDRVKCGCSSVHHSQVEATSHLSCGGGSTSQLLLCPTSKLRPNDTLLLPMEMNGKHGAWIIDSTLLVDENTTDHSVSGALCLIEKGHYKK